jgi:hypothetical protein
MSANDLNRSQVRGEFAIALEQTPWNGLVSRMALETVGQTATDIFGLVGRAAAPVKSNGALKISTPEVATISINNDEYETAEKIRITDLQRDQTGRLRNRISDIAQAMGSIRWEIMRSMIATGTATAYDGVALFSASHTFGNSGTQSNLLTSSDVAALANPATASAPTPEEVMDVINGIRGYFFNLKDWRGKQLIYTMKTLTLLVPANLEGAFRTAVLSNAFAGGKTNVLNNIGTNIEVVPVPELFAFSTTGATFYAAIDDGTSTKPFVFLDETAPQIDYLDESSEYAIINKHVLLTANWRGGVGPGEPLMIHKCTMS